VKRLKRERKTTVGKHYVRKNTYRIHQIIFHLQIDIKIWPFCLFLRVYNAFISIYPPILCTGKCQNYSIEGIHIALTFIGVILLISIPVHGN